MYRSRVVFKRVIRMSVITRTRIESKVWYANVSIKTLPTRVGIEEMFVGLPRVKCLYLVAHVLCVSEPYRVRVKFIREEQGKRKSDQRSLTVTVKIVCVF